MSRKTLKQPLKMDKSVIRDQLGQLIEMKVVYFNSDEEKERAEREIDQSAINEISSNYFVPILRIIKENNYIEILSEHYNYGPLSKLISNLNFQGHHLSEMGILVIFLPILKALYSLHQLNYVHRNISTDTIYLKLNGEIALGDFELIKYVDKVEVMATQVPGQNLPPDRELKTVFDVYSLGVVLFELIFLKEYSKNYDAEIANKNIQLPPHLKDSILQRILCGMLHPNDIKRLTSKQLIQNDFILLSMIQYRDCKVFENGDISLEYLSDYSNRLSFPPTRGSNTIPDATPIGKGAFGEVYMVTVDGFRFARKTIFAPSSQNTSPSIINFDNEIQFCPDIFHDNIIITYMPLCTDLQNKDPSQPISIYLEPCRESLNQVRERLEMKSFIFTLTGIYKILCSIVNALYALHKLHYLHRDLKPENILVTFGGTLVLSDLGFITRIVDNKPVNDCLGTIKYMAPEILACLDTGYNEACDIYSLGCLLYYICTFQEPKAAIDGMLLDFVGIGGSVDLPSHYGELNDLFHRMIDYNFNNRITIQEIINDPLIAQYNKSLRLIPFENEDGEVNSRMVMIDVSLDPKLRTTILNPFEEERRKYDNICGKDKVPNTFSLIKFYEYSCPLPHSNIGFLQLISNPKRDRLIDICLSDIVDDLQFLFPKVDDFNKESKSSGQNIFCVYFERIESTIFQFLKILRLRTDRSSGYLRIFAAPDFNPEWGLSIKIINAISNIFSIFTKLKQENKTMVRYFEDTSLYLFDFFYLLKKQKPQYFSIELDETWVNNLDGGDPDLHQDILDRMGKIDRINTEEIKFDQSIISQMNINKA